MVQHNVRSRREAARPRLLAIAATLLLGMLVIACQPTSPPNLPASTKVGPADPATALTPMGPAVPATAAIQPTAVAVIASPVARSGQRTAVTVTILHTNDVNGEIDPCG